MQENIMDTDFEDTIPEQNLGEQIDTDSDSCEIITPNDETSIGDGITSDAEMTLAQNAIQKDKGETVPFVTVQYNHKSRDFTKEEAIQLIQKGMHTEALRAKLEYLAKAQNTDVNTMVEKIISAPEAAYRAHLEKLYGKDSDDVEIGMQIYREKQSKEYKDIINSNEKTREYENNKNNINSRLADEYLYLKQQIPNAPQYSELPSSVIIEAVNGKRDLFSSYLCYLHQEQTKINAAQKTQDAAKSASSGAMGNGSGDINKSTLDKDFLHGLWSK